MSLEETVEACKNCRFARERQEPIDSNTSYQTVSAHFCVRYPPSTIGIIRVAHDGWCGEYKAKEE